MACIANSDICIFAGDDLRIEVEVKDQYGNQVDITTVTSITWKVANTPTSAPIVTKTFTTDISISPLDTFVFNLVPADTTSLSGRYYHEAEIVTSTGKTYTVLTGYLTVKNSLIG